MLVTDTWQRHCHSRYHRWSTSAWPRISRSYGRGVERDHTLRATGQHECGYLQCGESAKTRFLQVDEANPDLGPADRMREQGLQFEIDEVLLAPLRELADAPVEKQDNGEVKAIPFTNEVWEPMKAISPVTA